MRIEKYFYSLFAALIMFAGISISAAAATKNDAPAKPAEAAAADTSAPAKIDENSVIQKIKDNFVCYNGLTVTESDAEGGTCANGDYAIAVAKRIIDGTATEQDIMTIMRYFPQGRKLVEDLPTASCAVDGKLKLDFFIMSYCPYGVAFVDETLNGLVKNLGDTLDWTPRFIVAKQEDGKIISLHGQVEVDEDLRMICIREKYSRDKWLNYANCFSKEIYAKRQSGGAKDWKECALASDINPDVVDTCVKNDSGALMDKDMELMEAYQIQGSPTAVYNCNKEMGGAIPFEQIKAHICKLYSGEKPAVCKPAQPK